MRNIHFTGLENLPARKALKARLFVERYLKEHDFPYYKSVRIEIYVYPAAVMGHLYGVHAVLENSFTLKGDGLHRSLTRSLAEALEHIERGLHHEAPLFPGEAVL